MELPEADAVLKAVRMLEMSVNFGTPVAPGVYSQYEITGFAEAIPNWSTPACSYVTVWFAAALA